MNKHVKTKNIAVLKRHGIKLCMMLCTLSLILVSLLMLSGCSTKKNISVYVERPKTVQAPTRLQIIQFIKRIGVPVIQKDNAMVIVLSNDKLFQQKSSQLKAGSDRLLQLVALLMRKDQKVTVEVSTYSDTAIKTLAQKQMRYMTQQLWMYGMDARIVHTNYYSNAQLPWECGQLNWCTLIRYHYTPQVASYN
jgi:flagellar motor protein MotB